MPTPKQMEKMASHMGRNAPPKPVLGPNDDLPAEYWQALLDDRRAESGPGPSLPALRLSQLPQHILRVSCRRCGRVVEIQKADAARLYGDARWKDVGQKLLDNTCQVRRGGRYEEDGCWSQFG
jgi:hypothetical protein